MSEVLTTEQLREEIIRLGPWHYDIEVTPEISTRVWQEAPPGTYPESLGPVTITDVEQGFFYKLRRHYPDGLAGRTMLDCACNCGAYLFWAKEYGAGDCFGFDVRDHWIKQARFLAEHRAEPSDGIRFDVRDLYDLPDLGLQPFDVTLFNGIFYHLPDPISGLKIAADLTSDLIMINTASRSGHPDGFLSVDNESRENILDGVYGLNWLPTGPEVLERILRWLGFADTFVTWWNKESHIPGWGRLEIIASRTPEGLEPFRAGGPLKGGPFKPERGTSESPNSQDESG
jgi:tRNA (mo5U34)-methyltransferase